MTRRIDLGLLAEINRTARLSIPLAGAQLGQVLYGAVVTAAIGTRRPDLLGAGGLAMVMFSTATVVFGAGLFSSVAVLVAADRATGRNHSPRILRSGLLLAALISLGLVPMSWFSGALFSWAGQTPHVATHAQSLLRAASWGLPATFAFVVLRNHAAGLSRAGAIPLISLGGTVLFMLLSRSFAWTELAHVGHQIALTQWFMAGALFIWVFRSGRGAAEIPHQMVSLADIISILRIGLPVSATFGVEAGFFAFAGLLAGRLGDASMAAHQVAVQTCYLTFMVPSGIGIAAAVRVGAATGQGDRRAALRSGTAALILSTAVMLLSTGALLSANDAIVSLYLGAPAAGTQTIRDLARDLLRVGAAFQIADGLQGAAAGALRGRQKSGRAAIGGFFGYWVAGAGVMLVLTPRLAAVGVWWGIAVALAVTALTLTIMFVVDVAHAPMGGAAKDRS